MNMFEEIPRIVERIHRGEIIILLDEKREHEADLIVSAELVTPEHINFFITWGRGLVCVPLEATRLQSLNLEPITHSSDPFGTKWCPSIDARLGITTGISTFDRAHTIRLLTQPDTSPDNFTRPGHVFPLQEAPGGLSERQGHTEGSVALMRIAGLQPAAVICEIIRDDGHMAQLDDLVQFSQKHDLAMCTIEQVSSYVTRENKN